MSKKCSLETNFCSKADYSKLLNLYAQCTLYSIYLVYIALVRDWNKSSIPVAVMADTST